jgi:ribosomal protein L13
MDRRSIGSENSDKVGVAGKGNAKAKTWKATEEIGSRKRSDRVGNTEGKRPEESPRG